MFPNILAEKLEATEKYDQLGELSRLHRAH